MKLRGSHEGNMLLSPKTIFDSLSVNNNFSYCNIYCLVIFSSSFNHPTQYPTSSSDTQRIQNARLEAQRNKARAIQQTYHSVLDPEPKGEKIILFLKLY